MRNKLPSRAAKPGRKEKEMYENETLIELMKEIANDEIFNENQRRLVRIAIRCAAKFLLYDVALKGNSIVEATNEIEKMFPDENDS